MISSGQRAELRTPIRLCEHEDDNGGTCNFYGFVDAWYDPELSLTELTWECPRCKTEHTEDAG